MENVTKVSQTEEMPIPYKLFIPARNIRNLKALAALDGQTPSQVADWLFEDKQFRRSSRYGSVY